MIVPAILRHPAVAPVKRATKNLWWRYRGMSIANPPLPRGVRSVLFVCLGNICRSPFAEGIAARRLKSFSSREVGFGSAGIKITQSGAPPSEAKRVASAFGISLEEHRPRALTQELMSANDLIVVMEAGQMDQLRARYPADTNRVFLLSLFDEGAAGMERYVIADPFGRPERDYTECYERIDRTVSALIAALA